MSPFQAHKILVIGGTGAQGIPVVQGLYLTLISTIPKFNNVEKRR
jgi:hypothetical protein